jgi:hypothetical protein
MESSLTPFSTVLEFPSAGESNSSTVKELKMFARLVTMKLKANSAEDFSRLIDNEILPLLRKQKGFRDEITFVSRQRALAVGISLWDTKEDAVAYKGTGYHEVLKALAKVLKGKPTVETFEVANSTFHKRAAKAAAETA